MIHPIHVDKMETYLTEMDINSRYVVRVVHSDGQVCASGKFPTMGQAHAWIDTRRKRDVIDPEIDYAREQALKDLRW
jgi:hypothetical protein